MKMEDLAKIIWNTSRADEGTISATGANKVATALLNSREMAVSHFEFVELRVCVPEGHDWEEFHGDNMVIKIVCGRCSATFVRQER